MRREFGVVRRTADRDPRASPWWIVEPRRQIPGRTSSDVQAGPRGWARASRVRRAMRATIRMMRITRKAPLAAPTTRLSSGLLPSRAIRARSRCTGAPTSPAPWSQPHASGASRIRRRELGHSRESMHRVQDRSSGHGAISQTHHYAMTRDVVGRHSLRLHGASMARSAPFRVVHPWTGTCSELP